MANDASGIQAQMERLEDLAKAENRSPAQLLADAIEMYSTQRSRIAAEIPQALLDAIEQLASEGKHSLSEVLEDMIRLYRRNRALVQDMQDIAADDSEITQGRGTPGAAPETA
jgi:hypothetical protein